MIRVEGKNRNLLNNSWILQYISFNNGLSRQKIRKELVNLNSIINLVDSTDMYRILLTTTIEYK